MSIHGEDPPNDGSRPSCLRVDDGRAVTHLFTHPPPMKSPRLLSCLVGAWVLAGCATGPAFSDYRPTIPPLASDSARLWFYRPSKTLGGAVQPQVRINGIPAGKAQPRAYFYADRPAGTYEIECRTEWSDKLQVSVVAGEEKFIRLTLLPGVFVGHIKPSEVDREKALREIEDCRLITADGANADLRESDSK